MAEPRKRPAEDAIAVDRQCLAVLLHAFRSSRGESVDVVETRLSEAVQRRGLEAAVHRCELAVAPGKIGILEGRKKGRFSLSRDDWQVLSDAYGISRLMLDPLRVPVRYGPYLVQRLSRLVQLNEDGDQEYGHSVRYFAPEAKRAGTEDAAFVVLDLDPGGQSQVHAHPGDEVLFILSGNVEVRLETSGLTVRLSRGDYLHYFAEQYHSVRNPGPEPARVFVIRFYQMESGTRSQLLKQLRKTRRDRHVVSRAVDEIIALLTPTELGEGLTATEVRDRSGLGRLLQLLADRRYRGPAGALSVREVARRLRERGLHYTHSKVDRMHHGHAPIAVAELDRLAQVYEAEPLLLFEFLYPAVRTAIAVRKGDDYQDVPPELLGRSAGRYRVPCRRLSESDLGVAELILPRGAATPVNRHPGHELVIPLVGRARVCIGDLSADLAAGEDLFAHYTSEERHEVRNTGDGPAELLVVRFYE